MFYFLLGNLRPRYRSKTKVIQLAAICKYKFIKKYRMAVVLKPIVKDLLTLVSNKIAGLHYTVLTQEQGHDFTVQGRTKHIRGTIALVSADNPASAALGGFKESTSALRPCRQCTGLATDIKEMVIEFYMYTYYLLPLLCIYFSFQKGILNSENWINIVLRLKRLRMMTQEKNQRSTESTTDRHFSPSTTQIFAVVYFCQM